MRELCCETGFLGRAIDPVFEDRELFANFFTDYYLNHDWTDGCIAVTNADMVEIWMLLPDSVPIDIDP